MMRIHVPRDAAAIAVGADEVVGELQQAAATRGISIEIIRTGSRGLCWLEPMSANGPHKLRLGLADEIPWLKRQTRLTFARCGVIDPRSVDDYRTHGGYTGLERALSLTSQTILAEVTASGLRGRGGAGFPT